METENRAIVVPNADDMPGDIFLKHMRLRHPGSVAGIASISMRNAEDAWRDFHDNLHRFSINGSLDHSHEL